MEAINICNKLSEEDKKNLIKENISEFELCKKAASLYFLAAGAETDDKAKQKNLYTKSGDAYTKAENLAKTDEEKEEMRNNAKTLYEAANLITE